MKSGKHYNENIINTFKPYIGKRVLDVGCSIGNLSQHLVNSELLVGLDIDDKVLKFYNNRFKKHNNVKTFKEDISSEYCIKKLSKYKFDTILCSNVLEHIQYDENALFNMWKILQDGGHLLLLVPAHKWLYGSLDKEDGHYRRYKKIELLMSMNSYFEIEYVRRKNLVGLFGWLLNSKILRKKIIPTEQMDFFDEFVPILSKIENKIRIPCGLSLIVVGRKIEWNSSN
jgi:SAM-dependent methyltransferase